MYLLVVGLWLWLAADTKIEAMNRRSGRGHHIDPVYSLGSPPAASARAYASRSIRGSSPVASVVAMYASIRR